MAAFVTFLFLIFKPVMQLVAKLLSLQVILICSWQHANVTRYIRTDQREVSWLVPKNNENVFFMLYFLNVSCCVSTH